MHPASLDARLNALSNDTGCTCVVAVLVEKGGFKGGGGGGGGGGSSGRSGLVVVGQWVVSGWVVVASGWLVGGVVLYGTWAEKFLEVGGLKFLRTSGQCGGVSRPPYKSFFGNGLPARETSEPCCGPKWGRWVYEKANFLGASPNGSASRLWDQWACGNS